MAFLNCHSHKHKTMTPLHVILLCSLLNIRTSLAQDQNKEEYVASDTPKSTNGAFLENETTTKNPTPFHTKTSPFVHPRKYSSFVKFGFDHSNTSPSFSSINDNTTNGDILSLDSKQQSRVSPRKPDVRIGVLLPFDGNFPYTIYKVAPALEKAVDRVTSTMGPWNFNSLTLLYADTKCDNAESMNQAIQLEEHKKTAAFFGPVCDYAVAPVARQCKFWNTPLITAGGSALDYKMFKNTTYTTLTRVGPANLQASIELIRAMFIEHNWSKIKVIYDGNGQNSHLKNLCHFWVEYFVLQRGDDIESDHEPLGESYVNSPRQFILTEISTQYASFKREMPAYM